MKKVAYQFMFLAYAAFISNQIMAQEESFDAFTSKYAPGRCPGSSGAPPGK
ncbi:MAG: hypothetical protein GH151_00830 [Bacteroidetes bacterium]|nr:hypothetical protein [Bacteroidota bacterium]